MLISLGTLVTSVTSKESYALDDGPSVKRECETNSEQEQARENRFETLDSVEILTKV